MPHHTPYRAHREYRSAWPQPTNDGPMRILVIEDDKKTADYILKGLAECGYTADWVAEGPDGLHRATSGKYDALVVDRMLPGLDGLHREGAARRGDLGAGADPPRPFPRRRPGHRPARSEERRVGKE